MKYKNEGHYNTAIVSSLAKQYCKVRGINFSKAVLTSSDFLDFVLTITEEWATGASVKRFLDVYRSIRIKKGFHPPRASQNLLETFTTIYKAKLDKWKRQASKVSSLSTKEKINENKNK